ncbi:MAG TPA: vitamin K epoxide reductase family protein [Actinomycetota bacterium]|nr:vitamin K epoxide reductase family protein [Actinomycetota bacterium]
MRGRTASIIVLAVSAAGLAVSIYLTIAHYTSPRLLACGENGVVNCEKVTTSQQATFVGVPVALLGIGFFAAMFVLSLPAIVDRPGMRAARLILACVGMAFVLWLIYAEIALIGAICLWCTFVHLCTFAIFVAVLVEASRPAVPASQR